MKNMRVYIRVSKLEKSILEPSLFFSLPTPHSLSRSAPLSLSFSTPCTSSGLPWRWQTTADEAQPRCRQIRPETVRVMRSLSTPRARAFGSPSLTRPILALLAHTTLDPRQAPASSISDHCARPRLSRAQPQTRRDTDAPSDH